MTLTGTQWASNRRATATTAVTNMQSIAISILLNLASCLSFNGAMVVRIHPPLQGSNLKAARFIGLREQLPGRTFTRPPHQGALWRDWPRASASSPKGVFTSELAEAPAAPSAATFHLA